MARSARGLRVKRRLQGVAFLAVVAALLGFTVAVYNKALPWQSSDQVILEADRVGTQLVVPADVKLDGVLVGRVSGVSSNGSVARMTLQIDKNRIGEIPANVVARILPKTLFGEKFVDLVIPGHPSAAHLQPGAVIPQDRSSTAIELQTVFNDLVPLLRTLNPAELSVALSNLSDAVRGRGQALGENLTLVDQYFSRFNKDLPTFNHDIKALAGVAGTYADATPDLLSMLHNFSVNAHTFTIKKDTYAQFLTGTQDFARTATSVFGHNSSRLIALAHVSKPVLDLYAQFSPVLECLPNGLAIYDRTRLEQAFGVDSSAGNASPSGYLHITLTPVGDRGPYTVGDRPLKSDITSLKLAPNCFGLPYGKHGLHPVNSRYPGNHPSDNYGCGGTPPPPPTSSGSSGNASTAAKARRTAAGTRGRSRAPTTASGAAFVGSPSERAMVSGILAPIYGNDRRALPSASLQDLLVGPMLRGMAVSVV
jgi:phospholipid/cholesterol/gamma-HCH transport system substrate-binding protein